MNKKAQHNTFKPKDLILGAVGVFVIILVLVVGLGSWYSVPKGHVGVLFDQRYGFDYNEKPQGWGLKIPIVQSVTDMPFMTQTVGFYGGEEESARGQYGVIKPKDKNGISFSIDVTVRYSLDPTQAVEFVEQKGSGIKAMESVVVTATRSEAVRGVLGQENQEDIPSKLAELSLTVMEALQARIDKEAIGKLKPGFILVESVDLRNIDYNDAIEKKINEKQQAKQEAEKQEYVLQQAKTMKLIEITNAEKDRAAIILRAEGKSQGILLEATAKAKGIEKVREAYYNMPWQYVLVQGYQAIKPTDKVFFGLDGFTGSNALGVLDLNKLIGSGAVKTSYSNPEPEGEYEPQVWQPE